MGGAQCDEDERAAYKSHMNKDVMLHWLWHTLLPRLDRNALVVMDRAPYHTMIEESTS